MTKPNFPKTIIVTSRVTYMPENYLGLFKSLLRNSHQSIVGVIFLDNLDLSVIKTTLGLGFLGAQGIQRTLAKNILSLPQRKIQKSIESYGIPVKMFKTMNDSAAIEFCQSMDVDLIINARTRCIYRREILNIPHLGCLNIHHGLLPTYRGTMCDLYALHQGRAAGFTIHEMNERIDDGKIICTRVVSDGTDKNYLEHLKRGPYIEGQTLSEVIKEIGISGSLPTGTPNQTDYKVFTKNPNKQKINEMLNAGVVI